MLILITGAAGKTGRAILRTLLARGAKVRALVSRPEHIRAVERLGVQDVLIGDLRDPAAVRKAMQGVASVYHIPPNMHPDEIEMGKTVIHAAVSEGLGHFVYHSVLHPQVESMPHHWKKMRVEEALFECGLAFTILQPTAYMQNILGNWDKIVETGLYVLPYHVESRISLVDLEDVAQSAGRVLLDHGGGAGSPHTGATYELVGTPPLSQTEVAAILTSHVGRGVIAQSLPRDVWEQRARASGLGDYQIATLIKMFEYYEQYGLTGNTNTLSWLLERPAASFTEFVSRITAQPIGVAA